MFSPLIGISPEVGITNDKIIFIVVVLPAPFGQENLKFRPLEQ